MFKITMRASVPVLLAACASLFGSQVSAQQAIEPGSEVVAPAPLQLYESPPRRPWPSPFMLPAVEKKNDVIKKGEHFKVLKMRKVYIIPENSLWLSVESDWHDEGWVYAGPIHSPLIAATSLVTTESSPSEVSHASQGEDEQ